MIKTLRITSVAAAILAGILFVFPVIYGVSSDKSVDEFLKLESVREKFENAADNKAKTGDSRESPLVEQAEAFALYLNPLKPKVQKTSTGSKTTIAGRLPVTPKFKVFATSYFAEAPELSQALIDEPGIGRYWVRQSGKVGHLLVEQVKDGIVVVKSSEETFELKIEQEPASGSIKTAPNPSVNRRQSHLIPKKPSSSRTATSFRRTASTPQKPRINSNDEKMDEFVDRLKDLQRSSASDETDAKFNKEERSARIEELIAKFKSTRVSAEESKKLGNMGEKLSSKNQSPDEEEQDKAETDASEPDTPLEQ